MRDAQFGGRLILRDGRGEADLEIDVDNEWISLKQGDRLLGRYRFRDVQFIRMTESRIRLSFAGEFADFYPARPNEFVAALIAARRQHK